MNVTFLFLWENIHGRLEGNVCLMHVVTIFLSFSTFIDPGKDSSGYAFHAGSSGIPVVSARYIAIHLERMSLLTLTEAAPYSIINLRNIS